MGVESVQAGAAGLGHLPPPRPSPTGGGSKDRVVGGDACGGGFGLHFVGRLDHRALRRWLHEAVPLQPLGTRNAALARRGIFAVGRGAVADPLVEVTHVQQHGVGSGFAKHGCKHLVFGQHHVGHLQVGREGGRFRAHGGGRCGHAVALPGREAAVEHLDLGVAQPGQQVVAAARLAVTAVQRVFVEHRRLEARQPDGTEMPGEGALQFGQALGGRGGQEGEDFAQIHGAGNVAGSVAVGVARVDQNDGLAFQQAVELAGGNQDSGCAHRGLLGLGGEPASQWLRQPVRTPAHPPRSRMNAGFREISQSSLRSHRAAAFNTMSTICRHCVERSKQRIGGGR